MKDQFALSGDGLRIHYLHNGVENHLPALVIVPGMMGIADHYKNELSAISDRPVVAISHRGLGKSEPILPGRARFADRVSDIEAVVRHLGLQKYHLYGFSRGVALAVQHALDFRAAVQSLILHDCEPIYVKPSEKWVDFLVAKKQTHMPESTIRAYWSDAQTADLRSRLSELECKVAIYRGALEGTLLPIDRLESLLPKLKTTPKVIVFSHSAHEVSREDEAFFVEQLRRDCLEYDAYQNTLATWPATLR